jgi:hypothetical protein
MSTYNILAGVFMVAEFSCIPLMWYCSKRWVLADNKPDEDRWKMASHGSFMLRRVSLNDG